MYGNHDTLWNTQAEQEQAAAGADSGQVWRAAARSLNLDDAQKQARPLLSALMSILPALWRPRVPLLPCLA